METRDYFISYNKADKRYAKWIAGTLEDHGYSVYIQAWDIEPGDDFIAKMNDFIANSNNFIAILSKDYWQSVYCKKEFQTAFDAHLNNTVNKFLSFRLDDTSIDPLYKTTVYVDLFNMDEAEARKRILDSIGHSKNPRKKGAFPLVNTKCKNNETCTEAGSDIAFKDIQQSDFNLRFRNLLIPPMYKKKGADFFARRMYDVFHALGFGEIHDNIHKVGGGVSMILHHRTEKKIAIVECKSQDKKIGEDDLNKFAGALDVDIKQDSDTTRVRYYVSRSGFTQSAIEQEAQRNRSRQGNPSSPEVILMGPGEIVRELVHGNVICNPIQKAYEERIGVESNLFLCEHTDLIASDNGWIWVLYYSSKPEHGATHYALLHADGHQLIDELATRIKEEIITNNESFSGLKYLEPTHDSHDFDSVKRSYFSYLDHELGIIQFEGMPTDQETGTVKVNLEKLFVPMRFIHKREAQHHLHLAEEDEATISDIISNNIRSAILAKPGGGKSTLIRRIALAYAFPNRRELVSDDLPRVNYLPIYIRCRDLGSDAANSITQIIRGIALRAEIAQPLHSSFDALVLDALQKGEVLLLIDGLDEISNENLRIRFVDQLRTFVSIYPTAHLIITSRETGFRSVAGVLTSYCERYTIASLNEEEIRNLSLNWHRAILGESGHPEEESNKVCDVILKDRRIVALAENPLLMTTLLFVKRWIGYLPTKRCRLYAEMIELLLVTWNAAAHEQLELEETEPQLAFVAYTMTQEGVQKISKQKLESYIKSARKNMPEILGYTKLSPSQFIKSVENRSSLLIQSGFEEDDTGKQIPTYEFSHLSFQEYLTAKAIAETWLPLTEEKDLNEILSDHLKDENWFEVIPLSAVLSGRKSKTFIERLIAICENNDSDDKYDFSNISNLAALHLANCISNEVPMAHDLLDRALRIIIKYKPAIEHISVKSHLRSNADIFKTILMSRYGILYRETVLSLLHSQYDDKNFHTYCNAWIGVWMIENPDTFNTDHINSLLKENSFQDRFTGALLLMEYAFLNYRRTTSDRATSDFDTSSMVDIFESVKSMLNSDDIKSLFAASWCISWSGFNKLDIIPNHLAKEITVILINIWKDCQDTLYHLKRILAWACSSVMPPNIERTSLEKIEGLRESVLAHLNKPTTHYDSIAALQIAVLMEYLPVKELKKYFNQIWDENHFYESSRFLKYHGFSNKKSQ